MQKVGPFTEFSLFLFDAYARWKGTGEPWSNFTLKVLKIFPRHFWKIFSFLISLYSPLSHGMWILVQHPSIETLAFLEHSEQSIKARKNTYIISMMNTIRIIFWSVCYLWAAKRSHLLNMIHLFLLFKTKTVVGPFEKEFTSLAPEH